MVGLNWWTVGDKLADMATNPEYNRRRREKYRDDAIERERRKSQTRSPEENREYMRQYYAANVDRWAEYRRRPEVRERRLAARRERYANDTEYREKVKRQARNVDPATRRDNRLRLKFGIGSAEFDALLSAQSGRCAICPAEVGDSTGRPLHVDHDHDTGRVRGLLCGSCNFGLGKFQDDPELLISAANYLRRASDGSS